MAKMVSKKDYPSKQYLNLAVKEKKAINPAIATPAIIAIIILAMLFSKFAVIDRFAKVNEAEAALAGYKAQLAELQAQTADYDEVLAEYARYSVNWMDDVEKSMVAKTDMIDLINSEVLAKSETRSISISGNTIAAQLVGLSLSDTSKLVESLNARDDVAEVNVFTATTEETLQDQVIVSILITMVQEGGAGK